MPLSSLHHPFSDVVADIDGTSSVRTRLAACSASSSPAGRRGFVVDIHPSTMSTSASATPAHQSSSAADEKLPLRGFDVNQVGSTRSQRQSARPTAADLSPPTAAIIETSRGLSSSHSGGPTTTLHHNAAITEISATPRPLCVIDCCWCCAGSILVSWLKVHRVRCTLCLNLQNCNCKLKSQAVASLAWEQQGETVAFSSNVRF